MKASPGFAASVSTLIALASAATSGLAQPVVEVQYLAGLHVSHQTTPPTPVVPTALGNWVPDGFDVVRGGRMTLTLGQQAPRETYLVDGTSCTPLFVAGQQAVGLPTGVTYSGGIAYSDANNRSDPMGNFLLFANITGSNNPVAYWGPLDNLGPMATLTQGGYRIGPTASGWWMKKEPITGNYLVGTTPDPTLIRIATGQLPTGLPAGATNPSVASVALFDGGELVVKVNATIPGSGSKTFACIADSSGYRTLFQYSTLQADLGYYFLPGGTESSAVGGDGTMVFTGMLSTTSSTANSKASVWKRDALGHSTLLLRQGQQAPALPPGVLVAGFAGFPQPPAVVGRNGEIVTWCALSGPGVTTDNDSALFLVDAQGTHLLLRSGDTVRFGSQDVVLPAFCGSTAQLGSLYTVVWLNRRGDIALWTGSNVVQGFLATYHARTGWIGHAKFNTPPIAGFSTPQTIWQLFAFRSVQGTLLSSAGYDMNMQRLDDDGWVYYVMSLSGGNESFAVRSRVVLPPCPADFDGDGTVDFFDYDQFVTCFEGGACPPGATADFDHDGSVDFFDYDAFVIAFETPC